MARVESDTWNCPTKRRWERSEPDGWDWSQVVAGTTTVQESHNALTILWCPLQSNLLD